MNVQARKTAVGIFTVCGILFFILGLIALGGGRLFSDELEYIMYFDGSVSGLSVGAPVVFRGVPMGSVTRISLVAHRKTAEVTIPVYVRINEKSLIRESGSEVSEFMQTEIIRRMVQSGMRARLATQSLITGQARIELDFHDDQPAQFRSTTPDLEIPTIPSLNEELQRTLARVPLESIFASLNSVLTQLSATLAKGDLDKGLQAFAGTFTALQQTLNEGSMRTSLESSLRRIDNGMSVVESNLPAVMGAFRDSLTNLARAAAELKAVAASANAVIDRNSTVMRDLRRLLKEAADAAHSLREMANTLERNPEALLTGKRGKR